MNASIVAAAQRKLSKGLSQASFGHDAVSTHIGTGTSQCKATGTSQSQSVQNHAEVSRGAVPQLQYPGQRCTLNLEDLHRFQYTINQRLWNAIQALEVADKDLSEALSRVMLQVSELADSTANVVRTYGTMSQGFTADVLPRFYHAVQERDAASQVFQMAFMRSMITKMISDGKVVRSLYVSAMETVMYLTTCTQVALDFYECSEVDPESSKGIERILLESALKEMRSVCSSLANPSDFWLIFHMTELELGSIEKTIQKFVQDGCPATSSTGAHVCNSIAQISMQYMPWSEYWPRDSAYEEEYWQEEEDEVTISL